MFTLSTLIKREGSLSAEDEEWLRLIVGDWQLISDLSFADLVLWMPSRDKGFVAVAQSRPATSSTIFHDDLVGEAVPGNLHTYVNRAWESSEAVTTEVDMPDQPVPVGVEVVPMVRQGSPVAVITRHVRIDAFRDPSNMELWYLRCADDILSMGTLGLYPDKDAPTANRRGAPRAGDGLIRLDHEGMVEYASPNAISAFRRLGYSDDMEGSNLAEIATSVVEDRKALDDALPMVVTGRMALRSEIESRGVYVTLRNIPLHDERGRFGALVLCRDVTELRRRERELLSKDATIQEIQHRVKNNLQTVVTLLRLQARRLPFNESRRAIEQAIKRVQSIARVHDTLSKGLTQQVEFDQVIDGSFLLAAELASPGQKIMTERVGSFGEIPAEYATPLALVINELVSNSVEHGFGGGTGAVKLIARRDTDAQGRDTLEISVVDNGKGIPDNVASDGLGMQIVRTLVEYELGGSITWSRLEEGGTEAKVRMNLEPRHKD